MKLDSFVMLSTLIALIGSWKDKETWAGRMLVYQLRRMHLELGVTMYPPMMITEGMTVIQYLLLQLELLV